MSKTAAPSGPLPGAGFRLFQLIMALPAAGLGGSFADRAWQSWQTVGSPGTDQLLAALLGVGLLPLALLAGKRLAATPLTGRPFFQQAAYFRWLLLLATGAFLASVFGSRHGIETRMALHVFGFMALHRLLLCFPRTLQRAFTYWCGRPGLLRIDKLLLSLLLGLVMVEGSLQLCMRFANFPFPRMGAVTPFSNLLRAPIFGQAPNSLGYNDREFSRDSGDSLRVVGIGDSFFVGYVPRRFGIISWTERELVAALGPVQMYNFGINANSPVEYLEVLRQQAFEYTPDAVVVGVYLGNDITEGYEQISPLYKTWYSVYQIYKTMKRRRREQQQIDRGEYFDLTQLERGEREFWYAVAELPETRSRADFIHHEAGHLDICARDPSSKVVRAWQHTFGALTSMQSACKERGLPLYLVICPDIVQTSPSFLAEVVEAEGLDAEAYDLLLPQRKLAEFCRELGIDCIDLTDAFLAAGDSALMHQPNDNHWSAPGNELAGKALAEALSGLLRRDFPERLGQ